MSHCGPCRFDYQCVRQEGRWRCVPRDGYDYNYRHYEKPTEGAKLAGWFCIFLAFLTALIFLAVFFYNRNKGSTPTLTTALPVQVTNTIYQPEGIGQTVELTGVAVREQE
eukprot:TRINITY_DN18724_c0_g2_i6.p2 TRINITY_DN18724_c0_g2~~TRINITY_DN18724_c0_g2_i6.p2  ORF type:complete len:110 (+),score=13.71 TRINITY_DN18724_c0_g2_i6:46-375(+)